jgi:hypothetical protein
MDDEARQGALRFAEKEGGPFLREEGGKRIPPLVELPKLLSAAEHVVEDKETEEDLRLLLAPGSSLDGARPKATVIEKDGQLAIAKAMCRPQSARLCGVTSCSAIQFRDPPTWATRFQLHRRKNCLNKSVLGLTDRT